MLDNLAIIGYSGHAYVVIESALSVDFNVIGYCDYNRMEHNPYDLAYLGNEGESNFSIGDDVKFIFGIGDNTIRKKISLKIDQRFSFINVIDQSAQVSITAILGLGNFINKSVCVNAQAKIGNHCILNTGCIVEHECEISDFAHIGPGAVLAGNVKIGECTFVGANTVIKQGVKVGKNVIIGAGSVVIRDIPDNFIVAGNPSKTIKQ